MEYIAPELVCVYIPSFSEVVLNLTAAENIESVGVPPNTSSFLIKVNQIFNNDVMMM